MMDIAAYRMQSAKENFENLQEPLERLQLDLILSGEMEPDEFYVMPILLLGDPGIGKTFLAMQLAEALDVDMEKMGAGGAQGAFQLTGSHPSWLSAKHGSLIERLAKGKTSSPVVLIDEVDKIGHFRPIQFYRPYWTYWNPGQPDVSRMNFSVWSSIAAE